MKKVLVACDGSESSNHALEFVLDQPEAAQPAEIHLINVQEWPPVYSEYMTPMLINQITESQMDRGRRILDAASARVAAAKRTCQTHVLLGAVAQTIVDQAEKLGCDHIVMGTRGLGALKGLFVGSVTTRVVHLSKIPVTVISEGADR